MVTDGMSPLDVTIENLEILKVDMLNGPENVENQCRGPKLVADGGTVDVRLSSFDFVAARYFYIFFFPNICVSVPHTVSYFPPAFVHPAMYTYNDTGLPLLK